MNLMNGMKYAKSSKKSNLVQRTVTNYVTM